MSGSYWDVFRSLLDQMAHEDEVLDSRTLWLVVSQFLLLLCYFQIDEGKLPRKPQLNHFKFIGIIGILSAAFIYAAILAAELEFVELRSRASRLSIEHPDLPLRALPNIGIGSGLLCPIFLALLSLYFWTVLVAESHLAATLMAFSGTLFAVLVVGEAHEMPSDSIAAILLGATLPIALFSLAAAIVVGLRSRRTPS
jgi:hypothetical protein